MSQDGFGVMIGKLAGNAKSVAAFTAALGKTISNVYIRKDDALFFEFVDGSKLKLSDEGRSCCERRYMRTDDDLAYYIGAVLMGATIKPGPELPHEYGVHEVQFLEIQTDRGVFTMSSHNEHNGYYGGFLIRASVEP